MEELLVVSINWLVTTNASSTVAGGVIIARNWVLTAGHCIQQSGQAPKEPKDINIGVGITDLRHTTPENLVHVSRIVVYPQYLVSQPGYVNDVALIQTSTPILKKVGGVQTTAAVLPKNEQQFNAGTRATASGFGDTDRWGGTSSPVLKSVDVSVLPGNKCPSQWFKQEMHICAGNLEGGNDICQGDSGGPLVVKNQKPVIIGLPSFMYSTNPVCGAANEPTGYTKVSHYVNWIHQIIGPM